MYRVTSTEDQQKLLVPINRDTEKIFYDLRMIIDAPVLTEPRTWSVSKVNRISSRGLVLITLVQDRFDQHTDYIETDADGNVIGMWASYYTVNGTEPEKPVDQKPIRSEISCSGINSKIKVGGSYKKLSVHFYDEAGELKYKGGVWEFEIDGQDANNLITTLLHDQSKDLEENEIKVKFTGDDIYIGESLTVRHTSTTGVQSSIALDIVGL